MTMVGGVDVTFTPGYSQWDMNGETYHINWRLGDEGIYHVTKEGTPKIHYFFKLSAGVITDATAGKNMKGQKGTAKKFSALPPIVFTYITANVSNLIC